LRTSLQIERSGDPVDRSEVCRDLIRRLDHWYEISRASGPQVLNPLWRTLSEHLGNVVKVATSAGSVTGRLVDIDLIRGLSLVISMSHDPARGATTAARSVVLPLADVLALEA
jgi:biotin-(acetyl-CoA carboxylase) ligase